MSNARASLLDVYVELIGAQGSDYYGKNGNELIDELIESCEIGLGHISDNQLCKAMLDRAWDRPGAFYTLAARKGIKHPRELSLHAAYDPVFWSSRKAWQEERDYLKKVFNGKVPSVLNSKYWST